MVSSPTFLDNAMKVKPFHEDNFLKVKDAVGQIKNVSKELLQVLYCTTNNTAISANSWEPTDGFKNEGRSSFGVSDTREHKGFGEGRKTSHTSEEFFL